jgi:hypothetical protein|nr:hypothetical protein [uncultured Rhodopila sp.]
MRIILRFILRVLLAPVWMVVMLFLALVVLALLAAGVASVVFLFYAAVFALGYWVRHDPVMGRNALEALACGVGGFAVLFAIYGMFFDGIFAVWDRSITPRRSLQLRHSDEDFDENPL